MADTPPTAQPVSPHIGAAPRPAHGSVTTGIALMVAFTVFAPGIDVFAKLAAQDQPPGQVAAARFAVPLIVLSLGSAGVAYAADDGPVATVNYACVDSKTIVATYYADKVGLVRVRGGHSQWLEPVDGPSAAVTAWAET